MNISYSHPPIGSISKLAKMLDVSEAYLYQVAKNPENFYALSEIPKKNGDFRTISDPVKELKIVQRRIIRRIFCNCIFPTYLFGSIKDIENPRDFVRNAQFHSNANEVMAFDIDSFFPSIQAKYVKLVFKYLLNFPNDVSDLLVKLTTLNGSIPQGAPTSPYIANLVFYDQEPKLVKLFTDKKLRYSRLVDDITISSEKPISSGNKTFIYEQVKKLLDSKSLKINKKKYQVTNTSNSGKKTIVTGLVIENNIVKLPKETIKSIGRQVYTLTRMADVATTDVKYHKAHGSTSGLVALYSRLNKEKSDIHRLSLRGIKPTYSPARLKKIASLCRRFIKYGESHTKKHGDEDYAKKYYKYKHKISIIRRTDKKTAYRLDLALKPIKPLHLLSSYHE